MKEKRLLLLLLAAALLLAACGLPSSGEAYTFSLWYVQGEPLSAALNALLTDCPGALSVSSRSFPDREALLRALENGLVPDLLLGSHELAFSLYDKGLLTEPGVDSPSYPLWLLRRSDCVGRGFYPIGFSLPLLVSHEAEAVDRLWADAAACGREKGQSFLCVERFAPLFYQALLDRGQEFTADPGRDGLNENYVNQYNAIAEAWFRHGLSADCTRDLPCRVESSSSLSRRSWDGCYLAPLSQGDLLAEGYGLIVTAREPRSLRKLPELLRWLCEGKRMGGLALDGGLLPAVGGSLRTETPLQALLVSLRSRTLHLPDWNSGYVRNREAFEASFRESLELLH